MWVSQCGWGGGSRTELTGRLVPPHLVSSFVLWLHRYIYIYIYVRACVRACVCACVCVCVCLARAYIYVWHSPKGRGSMMYSRSSETMKSRTSRQQIAQTDVTLNCIAKYTCLHCDWTVDLFNVTLFCLCHIQLTLISSQLFFVRFGYIYFHIYLTGYFAHSLNEPISE